MGILRTTDIVCPKCGKKAKCETGIVLASNPPQFSWSCSHCGKSGFILCSELHQYVYTEPATQTAISCSICGSSIVVPINYCGNGGEICDECKEAIIWAKKKMIEDQKEKEDK